MYKKNKAGINICYKSGIDSYNDYYMNSIYIYNMFNPLVTYKSRYIIYRLYGIKICIKKIK